VWSTFFTHPSSQNNGGAALHIALKFSKKCDTTLQPNKGGYTIEHSHGTSYFWSGLFENIAYFTNTFLYLSVYVTNDFMTKTLDTFLVRDPLILN